MTLERVRLRVLTTRVPHSSMAHRSIHWYCYWLLMSSWMNCASAGFTSSVSSTAWMVVNILDVTFPPITGAGAESNCLIFSTFGALFQYPYTLSINCLYQQFAPSAKLFCTQYRAVLVNKNERWIISKGNGIQNQSGSIFL